MDTFDNDVESASATYGSKPSIETFELLMSYEDKRPATTVQ
jgi:hypothetical protein